ncbi:UNVERIFIED_ORG: II/X family phage/plasmid replication protein [Zoogloea ramigera]|uniref:Phage/plasmid replication protein n=1 Tax=Duganella zoogloeoides TaxID=75659 RepID=A0ABZ0Y203_9BURK|nr:phage/plasmid replication protein [Duganella zoogloeoides]WQH05437.1 phage/plasmid replication protein [Duganella zoogloeoides]
MTKDNEGLQHMTDCVMIDTMGLRVDGVSGVKLPKKFAQVSDDPAVVHNSSWAKGNLKSESGKYMPLRVRSVKSGSKLLVEGSNSMQYLDHNIVSSNNAVMTAFSMLDAVRRQYPLEFGYLQQPMVFRQGELVEVTRIDTPAMLKIPDGLDAGAVLNGLAFAALRAGVVCSIFPGESVYFDQHSQLASMKAYLKALELKQKKREHRLAASENTDALIYLAENTLRFEAVYRLKHLSRHFGGKPVTPSMLSPKTLACMFLNLLEGYDLKGLMSRWLSKEELYAVRMPYRSTVELWQHGVDLKKVFKGDEKLLASHRRVLKKEYSIDIFLPSPRAIEVPVELGEILRAENFVPVPAAIKADPSLFYTRDMQAEWLARTRELGQRGISSLYVDPYHYDQDVDEDEDGGHHD